MRCSVMRRGGARLAANEPQCAPAQKHAVHSASPCSPLNSYSGSFSNATVIRIEAEKVTVEFDEVSRMDRLCLVADACRRFGTQGHPAALPGLPGLPRPF